MKTKVERNRGERFRVEAQQDIESGLRQRLNPISEYLEILQAIKLSRFTLRECDFRRLNERSTPNPRPARAQFDALVRVG
jgi:hypothetical protein